MTNIVPHIVEHMGDVALLDPAIRVAIGAARDKITELVGEERIENLKRIAVSALKKNKERGVKTEKPSLTVSVPLLEAARDESRDELVDLWASLLATATDPKKRGVYRREFTEIAKQLEPIDALILPMLGSATPVEGGRIAWISRVQNVSEDEVHNSLVNLERLNLTAPPLQRISDNRAHPTLSPLGRQFLKAVMP